ncbi:leucine-rich_repeat domain-containing protein [Hexamita inflata]|uniref:Leucine-rich repeat domain-containing protein n=1 Tax=Hexamita inflata TaxID=28002 RepID=A0AA86UYK8_9EUKA|nr:leucine-rich repeat domain-containing protein [Hexamita inflata]
MNQNDQVDEFISMVKDGELSVQYNDNIINLQFLSQLNITRLNLDYCQKIQINSLTIPLENICINSCKQYTLDGINHQYNLKTLKFSKNIPPSYVCGYDNLSVDISALQNMVQLTSLDLSCNRLKDISALRQLVNLTYLNLEQNDIIDINMLKDMVKLEYLNLRLTEQKDISVIKQFVNLKEFNISQNSEVDTLPLHEMYSLTALNLNVTYPKDISIINQLTKLQILNLADNQIILGRLPKWQYKDCITEIWCLKTLVNVEQLSLFSNAISDIQVLKYMPHLTHLSLSDNKIINIDSLSTLTNLQVLSLSQNRIIDISALEKLVTLTRLDFTQNKIQSFLSLQMHPNQASYNISDQQQPTRDEILFSLKLKLIIKQNKRFELIKLRRIFNQFKEVRKRICTSLQRSYACHEQFTTSVVSIFEELNEVEQQQ